METWQFIILIIVLGVGLYDIEKILNNGFWEIQNKMEEIYPTRDEDE